MAVIQHQHFLCLLVFIPLLNFPTKTCEDAAVNYTVYSPLEKTLHHQYALHVPEDHGHLLASRRSCLKFLGPRVFIMLLVPGLLPVPKKIITCRALFESQYIHPKRLVCCINQEGTRKMEMVH